MESRQIRQRAEISINAMRNPVAAQVVIYFSFALQSFLDATKADHSRFGGRKSDQTTDGKGKSKKSCQWGDSIRKDNRKKQHPIKQPRSGRPSEIIAHHTQYAEPQLEKDVTQQKGNPKHIASRKCVDAIGRQDLAYWKEGSGRSKDWRRSKSCMKRDSHSVVTVSQGNGFSKAEKYERPAESSLPNALLQRSSQTKVAKPVRNSRRKFGANRRKEKQLWREARWEWGSEWEHESFEFLNHDS
jgi:hypothetical protein